MNRCSEELIVRAEWDASRVSVSVTLDGREHHVWFASSCEDLGRKADFLIPLTLFPAMVSGSRLKLPGKVSPRLFSAVPKIQDMFCLWGAEYWGGRFQDLQRVSVDAEVRSEPVNRASGVACLFSGGVDSFYTLLKHRDEVTHLIFVHGFDVPLTDQALRVQASRMAHEVANELGKTLIEVETNLRSFSNPLVGWEKYHGAALASVALLFQHRCHKVLVAASDTYAELLPWGSHPLLDPLWTTELTGIEHDGCEATRVEKIAYISEFEPAMKWLRVCYKNTNGAYNCGRCGKCLRAKITLRTVGAQERCKTLPSDLDLEEVANMDLSSSDETVRIHVQQNLNALERLGTEPELAWALAEALDKSSGTSEARAERAQRERLQQRLSRVYKKLERTRARLEASKKIAARSRARSERLTERNHLLAARYSGRRYKLADAFMGIALRIPGMKKLTSRKTAAD